MGSCVSLHRSSESAMKLRLSLGSGNDKLEIPPSPVKEKPNAGEIRIKDVALSAWSPSPSPSVKPNGDFGSKEETFFETQAWLDSDNEDFYSVNGDLIPSHGSTPVNPASCQSNGSPFEARLPSNSMPTPSPTTKKKRLLELFRESIRDDEDQAKNRDSSVNVTPFLSSANSVCSSERTPNIDSINGETEKPMRSVQCCLPSLVSCRSFSGRKKKMSPAIVVSERA